MKATASLIINQPIQTVFAYISNPDNMVQWMDSGSAATGEIVILEKPYSLGFRSAQGNMETVVELESMDGKTKVTSRIDTNLDDSETRWFYALFRPFIRRAMSKQLLKELEILKRKLES